MGMRNFKTYNMRTILTDWYCREQAAKCRLLPVTTQEELMRSQGQLAVTVVPRNPISAVASQFRRDKRKKKRQVSSQSRRGGDAPPPVPGRRGMNQASGQRVYEETFAREFVRNFQRLNAVDQDEPFAERRDRGTQTRQSPPRFDRGTGPDDQPPDDGPPRPPRGIDRGTNPDNVRGIDRGTGPENDIVSGIPFFPPPPPPPPPAPRGPPGFDDDDDDDNGPPDDTNTLRAQRDQLEQQLAQQQRERDRSQRETQAFASQIDLMANQIDLLEDERERLRDQLAERERRPGVNVGVNTFNTSGVNAATNTIDENPIIIRDVPPRDDDEPVLEMEVRDPRGRPPQINVGLSENELRLREFGPAMMQRAQQEREQIRADRIRLEAERQRLENQLDVMDQPVLEMEVFDPRERQRAQFNRFGAAMMENARQLRQSNRREIENLTATRNRLEAQLAQQNDDDDEPEFLGETGPQITYVNLEDSDDISPQQSLTAESRVENNQESTATSSITSVQAPVINAVQALPPTRLQNTMPSNREGSQRAFTDSQLRKRARDPADLTADEKQRMTPKEFQSFLRLREKRGREFGDEGIFDEYDRSKSMRVIPAETREESALVNTERQATSARAEAAERAATAVSSNVGEQQSYTPRVDYRENTPVLNERDPRRRTYDQMMGLSYDQMMRFDRRPDWQSAATERYDEIRERRQRQRDIQYEEESNRLQSLRENVTQNADTQQNGDN